MEDIDSPVGPALLRGRQRPLKNMGAMMTDEYASILCYVSSHIWGAHYKEEEEGGQKKRIKSITLQASWPEVESVEGVVDFSEYLFDETGLPLWSYNKQQQQQQTMKEVDMKFISLLSLPSTYASSFWLDLAGRFLFYTIFLFIYSSSSFIIYFFLFISILS